MKITMKKAAGLALVPLLSVSLSACSAISPSEDDAIEGLKETIAYQDNVDADSDYAQRMAECLVRESYDDLSLSGRRTLASGEQGELTFYDDDYDIFEDAAIECGWI